MRRLAGLLSLLCCGCVTVPGTQEGGPCNSQGVCVEPLACDVVQNICLGAGQSKWEKIKTTISSSLYAVWGITDDDYIAVGSSGKVLRYHSGDTQWQEDSAAQALTKSNSLSAIWARGSEVWVGGSGVALHWNGTWQSQQVTDNSQPATSFSIHSIWGTSSVLWAVGTTASSTPQVFRQNIGSNAWATVPGLKPDFTPDAIIAFDSLKVAVGDGKNVLMDYGGGSWTKVALDNTYSLNAMWGLAADNIWAAGSTLLHYDGNSWTSFKLLPQATSMWGTAAGDFYLVGGSTWGGIYHCSTGGACSELTVGSTSDEFRAVWCNESGVKVMLVGDNGITYRRGE
jgi:hypothetical protein